MSRYPTGWLRVDRHRTTIPGHGCRQGAGRGAICAAIGLLILVGCSRPSPTAPTITSEPDRAVITPALAAAGSAESLALRVEVVSTRPHDPTAFTQGLVWAAGELYESTGLYGESTIRRVDPQTGAVLQAVALPADLFGEGLALVDDRLVQLTWREGVAREYERSHLQLRRELAYDGEGWGLCYDGRQFVRSDGSSRLYLHRATDFAPAGAIEVSRRGEPVVRLNELECVGDEVYANVWQTDEIVRIDERTGQVTATIDASGLLAPDEAAAADVLNGIAYDPAAGTFLVTGKLWPKLFEVRFVPRAETP